MLTCIIFWYPTWLHVHLILCKLKHIQPAAILSPFLWSRFVSFSFIVYFWVKLGISHEAKHEWNPPKNIKNVYELLLIKSEQCNNYIARFFKKYLSVLRDDVFASCLAKLGIWTMMYRRPCYRSPLFTTLILFKGSYNLVLIVWTTPSYPVILIDGLNSGFIFS